MVIISSTKLFFEAETFAIIGASSDKSKLGWHIVNNFLKYYNGEFFLINPKGGNIEGHPIHKSILDINGTIDSAVIAIPAKYVPTALSDCVKKGVKSVIIESGGFAEVSEEGEKMQDELLEIIKGTNTRIIGPNCIGVYSPSFGIDTIFIPRSRVPRPKAGNVAFMTQSGALGSAILDSFTIIGDGRWISRFASYGNACDVNESDLLRYFGTDPLTEIVLAHLEGFKRGEEFLTLCKEISRKKPIIVLKSGRTALGSKASSSHSASIACDDAVVDDLLKQHGAIRVDNYQDLLNVAKVFLTQNIPNGDKVGIVTDGGGFAVIGSDSIDHENLNLAKLSNKTLEKFNDVYPSWYICSNPLDLTGTVTAEEFILGIKSMYFDENVDILVPIIIPSAPNFDVRKFSDLFSEFITEVKHGGKKPDKPILTVSLGGSDSQILNAKFDKLDIPHFSTPEEVFRIIRYVVNYHDFLSMQETVI